MIQASCAGSSRDDKPEDHFAQGIHEVRSGAAVESAASDWIRTRLVSSWIMKSSCAMISRSSAFTSSLRGSFCASAVRVAAMPSNRARARTAAGWFARAKFACEAAEGNLDIPALDMAAAVEVEGEATAYIEDFDERHRNQERPDRKPGKLGGEPVLESVWREEAREHLVPVGREMWRDECDDEEDKPHDEDELERTQMNVSQEPVPPPLRMIASRRER